MFVVLRRKIRLLFFFVRTKLSPRPLSRREPIFLSSQHEATAAAAAVYSSLYVVLFVAFSRSTLHKSLTGHSFANTSLLRETVLSVAIVTLRPIRGGREPIPIGSFGI